MGKRPTWKLTLTHLTHDPIFHDPFALLPHTQGWPQSPPCPIGKPGHIPLSKDDMWNCPPRATLAACGFFLRNICTRWQEQWARQPPPPCCTLYIGLIDSPWDPLAGLSLDSWFILWQLIHPTCSNREINNHIIFTYHKWFVAWQTRLLLIPIISILGNMHFET
jgi:hypothetical protein